MKRPISGEHAAMSRRVRRRDGSVPDEGRHQRQSEAIKGHQRPSEAIRGHQWSSKVLFAGIRVRHQSLRGVGSLPMMHE